MKVQRLVIAVFVVVAVGCGREGAFSSVSAPGAVAPTATPTTQPATTDAPSSTAPSGASASSASPPPSAAAATPGTSTAPLSEAALATTLLSASELSGWTEGGVGTTSATEGGPAPCGQEESKYHAAHEAEKSYSKGGQPIGDQLELHNESYTTVNEAHQSVDEGRRMAKECPTWTVTEDGAKLTFTAKEAPFPNIADETVAILFTFTGTSPAGPGFKINGKGLIVGARIGQNLVGVSHVAIAVNGEPRLDTAETETIARKAVAKFKRVA